jgi:hypothetical protein
MYCSDSHAMLSISILICSAYLFINDNLVAVIKTTADICWVSQTISTVTIICAIVFMLQKQIRCHPLDFMRISEVLDEPSRSPNQIKSDV